MQNNDGYRFVDPDGRTNAILEPNGKFTLKDGTSSIEVFANWRDFVKSMGEKPVGAAQYDDPKVLEQLSKMGLGGYQPITRESKETTNVAKKNATPANGAAAKAPAPAAKKAAEAPKAPAKKAAAPAAKPAPKAAPKAAVDPATLPICPCGCGEHVLNAKREFRQGHDARTHGYAKKIERGQMKLSELSPETQKWMREHGIKQGTAEKPAPKPKSSK
jgi:hypothetical protein